MAFRSRGSASDRREGKQSSAVAAVGDFDFARRAVAEEKYRRHGPDCHFGGGRFVSAYGGPELLLPARLVGSIHRAHWHEHEKPIRWHLGQRIHFVDR